MMNDNLVKITVVDDDLDSVEIDEKVFKDSHFDIEQYESGIAFFQHYENNDYKAPELLLLDIDMPEMNGLEVLEKALQDKKFSNTIFVSHSAILRGVDNRWLGYIGFDESIPKPIPCKSLVEQVKTLLKKKDQLISNRNPFKNLLNAIRELSQLRVRSAVLENEYIKKLISPEVFRILDSDPKTLEPKHQDIAIGFVDIRGFTQLANRLQIQQMNKILELFFEHVVLCSTEENGFIDKFIGDQVMWFHHSGSIEESSEQCIKAAINILNGMKELNKTIKEKLHQKIEIQVGVGVTSGNAVVGIFGAPRYRIQYSILGPPVNLAARLCSEAKAGELLIGGDIIEYCHCQTRKIGFQTIKGFDHQVELRKVVIPKKQLKRKK